MKIEFDNHKQIADIKFMTKPMTEKQMIKTVMSILGKKGGKTCGPQKARSPEHYARLSAMGVQARLAKMKVKK